MASIFDILSQRAMYPNPLAGFLSSLVGGGNNVTATHNAPPPPLLDMPMPMQGPVTSPLAVPEVQGPPAPGILDWLGIGQGSNPLAALLSSSALPTMGNMQRGLGAIATLPQQSDNPVLPPMPPQDKLVPALASAATAVLPERSPLMPAIQSAAAALPPPPAPTPAVPAGTTFKWPEAATPSGPRSTSIDIPGRSDIDRYADAIAFGIESGGNYRALGPVTSSGDRAYGKYQVMGNNVPAWTQEVLGRKMTPQEFLADEKAQEAVFRGKFGQYLQETGSPQDAASMWFSGRPMAQATAAGAKDILGTTVPKYIEKFNRALANQPAADAFPTAPSQTVPNLPVPPAVQAMRGMDTSVFSGGPRAVVQAPPMDWSDRITNVLGRGNAAAAGAKNVGDLLMAFAGGAGAGASENIARDRRELQQGAERAEDLQKFRMGMDIKKAGAEQEGQNFQIQAANETNRLRTLVATDQAKLDAAAQNRLKEMQFDLDLKKYELFQPQVKITEGGVAVVQRKPEGGMKVDFQSLGGFLNGAGGKAIQEAEKVYGKDSPIVDAMRYTSLGQQGTEAVKLQVLKKFVDKGWAGNVLGDQLKTLEKEVEKGLDPTLRGKPEEWEERKNEKMLGMLLELSRKVDPKTGKSLFPESLWIPFMAGKGDFGASMLMRGASGG